MEDAKTAQASPRKGTGDDHRTPFVTLAQTQIRLAQTGKNLEEADSE
jgi:hypothetical protein